MAAVLLALGTAAPAHALPQPRHELYWFAWWELQSKVWPITDGRGVTIALIDDRPNEKLADFRGARILTAVNPASLGKKAPTDRHDGDDSAHGNAMAGLIVGQGHGTGMVGVAPGAKLLPIINELADAQGMAEDIRYAADHDAKVISMSVGQPTERPCPPELQQAVDYAVDKDVVLVASAGNSGRIGNWQNWPANCAGVVTVGGVNGQVDPWKGTTPGKYVDVAAPAERISSVEPNGEFTSGQKGTSAAAALTSGVVALIRSRYPKMPAREVVQRLLATAKDTGPKGWDDVTGYGLVRPYRAIVDKIPSNSPNSVYDRMAVQGRKTAFPEPRPKDERTTSTAHKKAQKNYWGEIIAMSSLGVFALLLFGAHRRLKSSGRAGLR